MGYYVTLTDSDFVVPADKLDEAYEAVCKLNFTVSNDAKRGGRFPKSEDYVDNNPNPDAWFSWMDWNYHETCKDLGEVLHNLGFDVDQDDDGLALTYYDNKTGQEDLFIETLARFVPDGSYMDWTGEDGERERWEVKDGKLVRLHAEITWKEGV